MVTTKRRDLVNEELTLAYGGRCRYVVIVQTGVGEFEVITNTLPDHLVREWQQGTHGCVHMTNSTTCD